MNFQLLKVFVLHHIVFVEFTETVVNQLMAIWFFKVLENKFGETGKKGAWLFLLINANLIKIILTRIPLEAKETITFAITAKFLVILLKGASRFMNIHHPTNLHNTNDLQQMLLLSIVKKLSRRWM